MLSLAKMISKTTIDHVSTSVPPAIEAIFGPLTHISTCMGLDRFLRLKKSIFEIKCQMEITYAHFKELFFLIKTVPSI